MTVCTCDGTFQKLRTISTRSNLTGNRENIITDRCKTCGERVLHEREI